MTSKEFHALVEQHTHELGNDDEHAPLTLAQLARLERQKGIRFPAFYKELLRRFNLQALEEAAISALESAMWGF
jgi:hypothetical protein